MLFKRASFAFLFSVLLVATGFSQYYLPQNPLNAAYLIAGFDFSQLPNEGNTFDEDFNAAATSIPAYYTDTTVAGDRSNAPAFIPKGTLYFDGTYGSHLWDGENGLGNPGTVGGATSVGRSTNELITTSRRLSTAPANAMRTKNFNSEGGSSLGIGFTPSASVNRVAIRVDTTGYGRDFDLSFTAWTEVSGGSVTIGWFVQNGQQSVPAGTTVINSATPTIYSLNLRAMAGFLADRQEAIVVAQFSAPEGVICNLDNLQVIALPTAELPPSIDGLPPAGVVGDPYNFNFLVDGSPSPTLTVSSGSLPPGLVLSGSALAGTPSEIGTFVATVAATNGVGSPVSREISITVTNPGAPRAPAFIVQPRSQLVAEGATVEFSVALQGTLPAQLQWVANGAPISGATGLTLTLTSVSAAQAGVVYAARATNEGGTTQSTEVQLAIVRPGSRTVSPRGEIYRIDVSASASLAGWTTRSTASWVKVSKITTEGTPYIQCVVDPWLSPEADSRDAIVTIEHPVAGSAQHQVIQRRQVLIERDFPAPDAPGSGDDQWQAYPSSTHALLSEFQGIRNVLGLAPSAGAGRQDSGGLVMRAPLASSGSLRIESIHFLELGEPLAGLTRSSVALYPASSDGSFVPSSVPLVRMSVVHDATKASEYGAGPIWLDVSYLDETGKLVSLNRSAAIPRADLAGVWPGLRIEIDIDRSISFWADVAPFGDPICLWMPTHKVNVQALGGQRVAAEVASNRTRNRPYIAGLRAWSGELPLSTSSELVNLSSRIFVGEGDRVGIAGLITANGNARTMIRGVGPGLTAFGVTDTLPNPRLVTYDGNSPAFTLRVQDAWEGNREAAWTTALRAAFAESGAFPLANGSADSAWIYAPGPGLAAKSSLQSVHIKSATGTGEGTALVEMYRLSDTILTGRFINLSTRSYVPPARTAILGFVVRGNASRRYLLRAVGPGLRAHGVKDPLMKTAIRVYQGQQLVGRNSVWSTSEGSALSVQGAVAAGAFPLTAGSEDSALVLRLQPGAFTVLLNSPNTNQAGTALLEVYELSNDGLDTSVFTP